MGFFGKSEEKKKQEELKKLKEGQRKVKNALQALGVDFDSYTDKEIEKLNKKDFKEIKANFWPSILSQLSTSLQMDAYKNASLLRFSTLVYQNWILIRQNELIIRHLEKLTKALINKRK